MKARSGNAPAANCSAAGARVALLLATALAGCAAPGSLLQAVAPTQEEINRATSMPVVVRCFTSEFGADSAEATSRRQRPYRGVEFVYTRAQDVPTSLVATAPAPQHLFVVIHGWLNDDLGSRDFTSRVVRGLLGEAEAAGLPREALAFAAVHWDSARALFHESAATAEVIGRERVAPLLVALRRRFPATTITLVGHSLGARLILSTLHRVDPGEADAAVLLQAAADHDALHRTNGLLGFGFFPRAPAAVRLLANVHSVRDDVLDLAYRPTMQSAAMGRDGAERAPGARFPFVRLTRAAEAAEVLEAALADPQAQSAGGAVVLNVDASGVVPGHTEVHQPAVYHLAWQLAERAAAARAATAAAIEGR